MLYASTGTIRCLFGAKLFNFEFPLLYQETLTDSSKIISGGGVVVDVGGVVEDFKKGYPDFEFPLLSFLFCTKKPLQTAQKLFLEGVGWLTLEG